MRCFSEVLPARRFRFRHPAGFEVPATWLLPHGCLYCVVTDRGMRLDTEMARWCAVADDPGRSWEEKLAATIQRAFPPP